MKISKDLVFQWQNEYPSRFRPGPHLVFTNREARARVLWQALDPHEIWAKGQNEKSGEISNVLAM